MMSKQSAMLARLQAQYEARSAHKVMVALQMAKDAADMAANDVFGLGEGRSEIWTQVYSDYLNDIMELINEDGKSDPEIVYAKTKIDGRLKDIHKSHFQPWEVRYEE